MKLMNKLMKTYKAEIRYESGERVHKNQQTGRCCLFKSNC